MPSKGELGMEDGRVTVEPWIDKYSECAGLRRARASRIERREGEEEGSVCNISVSIGKRVM